MLWSTRASLWFFSSSQPFTPPFSINLRVWFLLNPTTSAHPISSSSSLLSYSPCHPHLHLHLSSSSTDNMLRLPKTSCANWSPGNTICKRDARVACSNCRLVEVNSLGNILLLSWCGFANRYFTSIADQIVRKAIGLTIDSHAILLWMTRHGSPTGLKKTGLLSLTRTAWKASCSHALGAIPLPGTCSIFKPMKELTSKETSVFCSLVCAFCALV